MERGSSVSLYLPIVPRALSFHLFPQLSYLRTEDRGVKSLFPHLSGSVSITKANWSCFATQESQKYYAS